MLADPLREKVQNFLPAKNYASRVLRVNAPAVVNL